MKIVLFMAMSINGMIASDEGHEDFLSHANWISFCELAKEYGCFIIGRKTYEAVQQWPDYNFNDIEAGLKIVLSHDATLALKPPFLRVGSPQDAIAQAAARGYQRAILTGGSMINSAFLSEDLIDEVWINIEPAIVGKGMPLFARTDVQKRLSFLKSETLTEGIVQIRYKVNRE